MSIPTSLEIKALKFLINELVAENEDLDKLTQELVAENEILKSRLEKQTCDD